MKKPEVYSLADEFAKSKKNKNFLVYVLIIVYVATIGIGVFFITTIEDNKSKRVEVNIAEFKQFNLMELLAQKRKHEAKLTKLQQELEDLRASSMKEIQKLSPMNQQKAIAELNDKMKKLEESYNQQITTREDSLKKLEKSITAEQQQMAKTVQDTKSQVKNYQSLNQEQGAELVRQNAEYESKIAKLTADHHVEIESLKKDNQALIDALTLRYNPTYSQGEIAAIINSKLGNKASDNLNKFDKTLSSANILSEQDFNQLRKKIQNQKVIINSLQQVPYTNSVPLALNRLDRLSQSIIGDYETLWGNLAELVNEKNDYLSSYEYAVNYLSMTRHESGYIMDARNPNRIVIFIDHVYVVKNGDVAYIFKTDDTPIAKIELNQDHGQITAKVIQILKPVKIEPFDRILLKIGVTQ